MRELFEQPLIAIDLGASFTKVAFRPAWEDGAAFREPCKLVMIEGSPLIPSLVIRVARAGKTRWLCGKEAAEYKTAFGDRVFQNWKAGFFSKKLDSHSFDSIEAAKQFFKWLREQLIASKIPVNPARVKVCLPAFPDVEEPATMIGKAMDYAGWSNQIISRVEEPRANTIGVFSEGRNYLTEVKVPGGGVELNPIFSQIYTQDSPILSHLRSYGLFQGRESLIINIVDVGSFTTDVSVVRVNAAGDGDYIERSSQMSYEVGITAHYEAPLLEELAKKHDFDLEGLSFDNREEIKLALGSGGHFAVVNSTGNAVSLGQDDGDKAIARRIAISFARQAKKAFLKTAEAKDGKFVVFTGGGCGSDLIRKALETEFKDQGMARVLEGCETETGDKKGLRLWPDTEEPLSRLATALGGGSVLLEFPMDRKLPIPPKPKRVESNLVVCSCRGGNKDCLRCAGQGQYVRERLGDGRNPCKVARRRRANLG